MGKHTDTLWRKSTKKGQETIEQVAISVPPWATPELLKLAQAAMSAATAGVPLGSAPMAVVDPLIRGMIDVFLAGYEACLHPGPAEAGIEAGAQHMVTQAAAVASVSDRSIVAKIFRRAAELYESAPSRSP